MPNQWFVEYGNQTIGPLSDQQLKKSAEGGQVNPSTQIRLGVNGQWVTASSVKGLFPSPLPTPAADLDDLGFDSLISDAIATRDTGHVSAPTNAKPEPISTTFKPRDFPSKDFDSLQKERRILWGISILCTALVGPLGILIGIGCLVGGSVLAGQKQTEPLALPTITLAVSVLGVGISAFLWGVVLRIICGTVDLSLYVAALLEDVRQHTRER
jgi:hypothetical protein